jgi:hypothetical protein
VLDAPKFYEILPALKQKLTGSSPTSVEYGRSWISLTETNAKGEFLSGYKWDKNHNSPSDNLWFRHFEQVGLANHGKIWGSLAISGKFMDGDGLYVMWIGVDADNEKQTELVYDKLIPHLNQKQIPFLLEYGGAELERRKVWIFTGRCDLRIATEFVDMLLEEAGLAKDSFDGIYPTHSGKRSLFRISGGYYPKRKNTFPVEIDGELVTDPLKIMQAIINCPIFDEGQTRTYISSALTNRPKKPKKKKKNLSLLPLNFRWIPLNLPLPSEDIPGVAKTLCQHCPAYHHLISETINNKMIDDAGFLHHKAGVCLSALGQAVDKFSQSKIGEKWFDKIVDWYRSRDPNSHNWKHGWGTKGFIWKCQTMQDNFDKCGGCPHQGAIESPAQLLRAERLAKTKIGDVFLTSPEWIRENTFPKVKQHIWNLLAEKKFDNILLKSPPSSGKSWLVDSLTAELVRNGKTVLIAVPTAELAMERKRHLKELGCDAFAILSHEKLMEHLAKVDCPEHLNIQEQLKLGVSGAKVKSQFCKGCKFNEDCPYPRQYVTAKEESIRVLIIQHAHFSTQETLYQLVARNFDVMFVDESFVDSVFTDIKATTREISVLEEIGEQWSDDLVHWLKNGGEARGRLNPDAIQLENCKQLMLQAGAEFRIPDFLRLFSQGQYYSTHTGAFRFHPLPVVPVRVFTDATPPQEIIEKIINKPLTVFGEGEVLDYRLYNERNRVIQVIDGSMAKSALLEHDYALLISIMEMVGDLGRNEHKNERILITTYADQQKVARDWLKDNYPDVFERCTFNLMSVGTNAHVDKSVQVLVAGLYINPRRMLKDEYRLKEIINYWNRMDLRPEINNIYPYWIEEAGGVAIDKTSIPVRKILPDGLFEFNLSYQIPKGYYKRLIHEWDMGRTQQAMRIRPHTTVNSYPMSVYVIGNTPLPSLLISEIRTLRQLVRE